MTINDSENDNTKDTFTFVVIPAGDGGVREVTKPKPNQPEDDELKKFAKAYFGYTHDTQDGHLERNELDYPRPANNHTFVTMFSYSNAQAEKMPANRRASVLASACMTFEILIYGDAFVGRYFDHSDDDISLW